MYRKFYGLGQWLVGGLLLWSAMAYADDSLLSQIKALLHTQLPVNSIVQQVTINTQPQQLPQCAHPQLSLTAPGKIAGKMSITARCGEQLHFIQVNVSAKGTYWVARHRLTAGSLIHNEDLLAKTGTLDHLPPHTVYVKKQLIGHVITQHINAGQVIQSEQLRPVWRVKYGTLVDVLVEGDNFTISAQGKALANGAENTIVPVRMSSGHEVNGRVNAQGQVVLSALNTK